MKRLIFGLLLVLCLLFYLSDQMAFSDSTYLMQQAEIERLKENLKIASEEVSLLRMDLAFVSGNQKISSKISETFKKKIEDLQRLNNEAEKRLDEYTNYYNRKIDKMTESEKKIKKELEALKSIVKKLNEDLLTVRRLLREQQTNRIIENIGWCIAGVGLGVIISKIPDIITFFTGGK